MKINLHIKRLVLDGLPVESHQGALIQSAIETELARLLAEGGLASELMSGGALSRMPASSIQLTSEATPAPLGQQIAGAVYGGIGYKPANERSERHSNSGPDEKLMK